MKFLALNRRTNQVIATVDEAREKVFPLEELVMAVAPVACAQAMSPDDIEILMPVPFRGGQLLRERLKQFHINFRRSFGAKMTVRETQVMQGIARCLSNKEIAHELNLSVRTIKFHVSSLLQKYRVRGRSDLALCAARLNLTVSEASPPPAHVILMPEKNYKVVPRLKVRC